jgi:hypothetical protein
MESVGLFGLLYGHLMVIWYSLVFFGTFFVQRKIWQRCSTSADQFLDEFLSQNF